jgi:Ser/Thr protein kinase RdoA (MazF antagonist)
VPPLRELAWAEPPLPQPLRDLTQQIRDARAWAVDLVASLRSRRLVTGLVHGDFFRGNVLVAGDRAVGLVDWEEMTVDWDYHRHNLRAFANLG